MQNRVIFTDVDYAPDQLVEAANVLNAHYAGLAMEQVRERLKTEVERLRGEVAALMQAAVSVGSEALSQAQDEVVISGERNLLSVSDFAGDMHNLRRAFDLFEQRRSCCGCWTSSQAEGAHFHRRRKPGGSVRRSLGRQRTLRGGWPGRPVRWASSGPRACRTTG